MKLHDLRPAEGAHRPRTRVGRGIAAGKGKTAGRGTKGQKARAGGSIAPWFEGGQTPLHVRIPKLRGFRNPFKVEYEVVNVGRIAALVEAGRLEPTEAPSGKGKKSAPAPITVNQDILRAVGAVRSLDKPLKILGGGDVDVPLFVVADAFTASARSKIEAAGGSVQVLEMPTGPLAALGVEPARPAKGAARAPKAGAPEAAAPEAEAAAPEAEAPEAETPSPEADTADEAATETESKAAATDAEETPTDEPADDAGAAE
jgi:large subunit ribosomal protein L15